MKKIALLFLTRNELNNFQIWKNYFNNDFFNIYIHPNLSYSLQNFSEYQVKNVVKKTSGYNFLATFSSLKEAFSNKENFKFCLLSDDCIPLTSAQDFYNFACSNEKSNMRYGSSWITQGNRFINEIPKKDQMANAEWFLLNRDHVEIILENENMVKDVFCKYCVASEHAPSTILHLAGQLNEEKIENKDILYEKFLPISVEDYSKFSSEELQNKKLELIDKKYFFMRKFIG
jgi:hypothetical protein